MAQKMSTGLCNKLLDTDCFREIFDLGFVKIYSGTVPATADAALGGATLLCTVSINSTGTGLEFAATASGGVLAKDSGDTWSGTNAATGTASFYRLVAVGDDGTSSSTQARVQGTIGTGGSDMNVGSTTLTSGQPFTLNYFTQALVPS